MSDEPWPLPTCWRWTTLGEVATEVRNGVFVSRPSREPVGPAILRISAVRPMSLDVGDVRFTTLSLADEKVASYQLRASDLLFTRYSGSRDFVGACAQVGERGAGLLYPDKLIRVRVDERVASPAYVEAVMASQEIRALIEKVMRTTAGQTGISGRSLKGLPLPLPPVATQNKLVESLAERLSHLSAGEDLVSKAASRSAFAEDVLLEQATFAHHDSTAPSVALRPIGELLREPLRNGRSAPAAGPGSPSVRTFTLTAATTGDFSERNTKLAAGRAEDADGLWAVPGDIFVERSNTPELVGTAALYDGPENFAIFPDLLIRVRVDENIISPRYLTAALRAPSARRYFRAVASGLAGSMPKIDQPRLSALLVPVPALDEQVRLLASLDGQLARLHRVRRTLELTQKRSEIVRRQLLRMTAGVAPTATAVLSTLEVEVS